ncbi:MAG: MurR/RpiR family transcriptional regulator [Erysipelotrichaceae bacterium]|nr:MurR/RpiR family transcriptional regulator [Erysipelotrichaceae bacterium]
MNKILQNINTLDLTPNEVIIYEYMIENELKIPHMSLEQLANATYLSTASIVRFAQKLGYTGYNQFKYAYKQHMNIADNELISFFPEQQAIMRDSLECVDEAMINKVCDLIETCDSIYIYGRNMSSIPADCLYHYLQTFDIPCIYIDWVDFIMSLSTTLKENSLLILFTNYADAETYKPTIEQFRKRNTRIVLISSTPADSSLIAPEDLFILAPEDCITDTILMTKMPSIMIVQLIINVLINRKM